RLGFLEGYHRPGPYGGFLGPRFDPVCTRFGNNGELLFNPNGVNPNTLKFMPAGAEPEAGITLDQLNSRASLLEQLDTQRRTLGEAGAGVSDTPPRAPHPAAPDRFPPALAPST